MQQITREFAEQRLGEFIARGRSKSANVVKSLAEETAARVDLVVPRQLMRFTVNSENITLKVEDGRTPDQLLFSEWSEDQMLGTLRIPSKFVQGLQHDGDIGSAIATDTLNSLRYRIGGELEQNGKSRRLLRVVHNQVRGWLSSSYGMFDQGELLNGFAAAIRGANNDIVFTDGTISDRRYAISAILPQVIEVWEGEFVVLGGQLQSSDYGYGAVDLLQQVTRVTCWNGAIGSSYFRKVHKSSGMGGDSNGVFEISERTRQLGSATTISLMTDAVRGVFGESAQEKILEAYRAASLKTINPEVEAKMLREKGILAKEDESKIPSLLAMDLEILPDTASKNSALRFGQLLAFMSKEEEGEKNLMLMEAAGKYYLPK